jgi:hypothetical protein
MLDWKNLAFASREILLDKECIIVAASMNAQVIFDYANESLLLDRDVILAAIKSNEGGDLVFEKLINVIGEDLIINNDNNNNNNDNKDLDSCGTGSEDSGFRDNEETELNDKEGYKEVNHQGI